MAKYVANRICWPRVRGGGIQDWRNLVPGSFCRSVKDGNDREVANCGNGKRIIERPSGGIIINCKRVRT